MGSEYWFRAGLLHDARERPPSPSVWGFPSVWGMVIWCSPLGFGLGFCLGFLAGRARALALADLSSSRSVRRQPPQVQNGTSPGSIQT